jgi:hypothetical protein
VFEKSVWLLIAVLVGSAGCARPLALPSSSIAQSGEMPGSGLPGVPHITADQQPITFVGLDAAEREEFEKYRKAFDEARQQRIGERKTRNLGSRNTPEAMAGECIIKTLVIFSPLCILVVPMALGAAHAVEGPRAAKNEPYLPALPSDPELLLVGQKIREELSAVQLARQMANTLGAQAQAASEFPRLEVRAISAKFSTERTIAIEFIVQAHPAAGVAWQPTQHRLQLGYTGDADGLAAGLKDGRTKLAESILSTYRLADARRFGDSRVAAAPAATPVGLAGVLEQDPKAENNGCAPFNARVGNVYAHENGNRVTVRLILGESPRCPGARPLAVKFD